MLIGFIHCQTIFLVGTLIGFLGRFIDVRKLVSINDVELMLCGLQAGFPC
jgi:hypothetical protein